MRSLLRRLLLPCLVVALSVLPLLGGPEVSAAPPPTPEPTVTPTRGDSPPPVPPTHVPASPLPTVQEVQEDAEPTAGPSPEVEPSPQVEPSPEIEPSPQVEPSPEIAPSPEIEPSPEDDSTPMSEQIPADTRAVWDDAVGGKWLSLGGADGWLGEPQQPLVCGLRDGGCFQHFAGGSIYWTPSGGAWALRGAIRARWAGDGWETGRLGYPISEEFCGLRDGGCGQRFQGGLILWSVSTGARASWGAIGESFRIVGWEASPLGYPISEEFCGLRDGGCGQRFQGGVILWSPRSGAHPVWGAIHSRFAGARFEAGQLGYPTSGEFCGLRGGGCGQRFTDGNVYWTPGTGVRAVWGAIRFAYAGSRWEAGPLGYPISEEFCGLVQSGCGQRFQGGLILWSPGTGPHPVRGAILAAYADRGYERGELGYPRSAETAPSNGVVRQQFQNAVVTYTFATGHVGLPGGGYPDQDATPCGDRLWCKNGYRYSERGFAYRHCTDYVAWRKGMVWSQIAGGGDGNARGWRQGWIERGRTVSSVARVGAIAWWGSYGNGYGHVALVTEVNPDGSVTVEHFNFDTPGGYSVSRNMRAEAYLY